LPLRDLTHLCRLIYFVFVRFVLASTEELHEKIDELADRVRQLEDALRYAHSHLSPLSEPHPLLTEDLLKIKAPLQREHRVTKNGTPSAPNEEHNPDMVDAFGTLSISLSGRTKYFGHIANSWVRSFTIFYV
jgi:hypothetical protein